MRHSWRIINFPTSIWNAFNFSKWLFSAIYAVLRSSFPLIWIEIGNVLSTRNRLRSILTMGIADSLFRWFFLVFSSDYVWNSQINYFSISSIAERNGRVLPYFYRILQCRVRAEFIKSTIKASCIFRTIFPSCSKVSAISKYQFMTMSITQTHCQK